MRTAVLTVSISRAGGGVAEISRRIAQTLARHPGVTVDVISLQDSFTQDDLSLWEPLHPKIFSIRGPRSYGYSPGLVPALKVSDADVAHVHGMWTYPSLAARQWSSRSGRPYMVTVHGMLEPWALKNSRWKKRVAHWLVEGSVLRNARCLHVNTPAEASNVRKAGFSNSICVIPNGVDLPEKAPSCPAPWNGHLRAGTKTLLYLGRLHPKKGLINLLKAWGQLQSREALAGWNLVIAGWDQCDHERELKRLSAALGLEQTVYFAGPQFGEAKAAAYACASAFILPSYSEGLPMVVLEAWAHSLPVIMTPGCNLLEGFHTQSALRIEADAGSIAAGLSALFSMSDAKRSEAGQRGRRLVEERFSWGKVTQELMKVYEWMRGGGDTPKSIAAPS